MTINEQIEKLTASGKLLVPHSDTLEDFEFSLAVMGISYTKSIVESIGSAVPRVKYKVLPNVQH